MRRLVNVTEVEDDGFVSLMGKKVLVTCARYAYAGVLSGVNETCISISNPSIVYETGPWGATSWKDAQSLNVPEIFIQVAAIESFMEGK